LSTLEFLCPDMAVRDKRFQPLAHSPMERRALAAGARLEVRDGFNVAVSYGDPDAEAQALAQAAGFCDCSQLGKLELQAPSGSLEAIMLAAGGPEIQPRLAGRAQDAWWCPLTDTRALVICPRAQTASLRERLEQAAAEARSNSGGGPGSGPPACVVDVSCAFAAMTIAGPAAREVFARFCALDLRPASAPPRSLRPGSIARQPGILIVEAPERYLFLFGWATGEYMWTVVSDAAQRLGGRPVGIDALAPLSIDETQAVEHA
jgi:glycine cleavage system aminomethyltransferase T